MNYIEEDLSPGTIRMVEAMIASVDTQWTPSISEELLARFALGWLEGAAREEVLEALVQSVDLRAKLLATRRSLLGSARHPSSMAGFLNHAVQSVLDAFSSLERGIESIRLSSDSALILRNTYQALTDRARMNPSGLALARSAASLAVVEIGHSTSKLSAEVLADGALEVRGEIRHEDLTVDQRLSLEIVDPIMGPISIGVTPVIDGHWRFYIPGFGPWEPSTLAASRFQLRFVDPDVIPEVTTLVAVTDADECVTMPLTSPPSMANGELTLDFQLDARFRDRFAKCELTIGINASPAIIPLGVWAVSALPNEGPLMVEIPTSNQGHVPRAALALTLRPIQE